jgi:hypothetical protein
VGALHEGESAPVTPRLRPPCGGPISHPAHSRETVVPGLRYGGGGAGVRGTGVRRNRQPRQKCTLIEANRAGNLLLRLACGTRRGRSLLP